MSLGFCSDQFGKHIENKVINDELIHDKHNSLLITSNTYFKKTEFLKELKHAKHPILL